MNVIENLIDRIEEYRATNKSPCKSYATEQAASKAAGAMAVKAAQFYGVQDRDVNFIVFFNPAWGRWCAAFDLTGILRAGSGGYVGHLSDNGFYSY